MKIKLNEFEYDLLKDTWEGPKGAAWNACWEYCYENGLITGPYPDVFCTRMGLEAVREYEKSS